MLRHGFSATGLRDARPARRRAEAASSVEGVALHLPLAHTLWPHLSEVERLMNDVVAAGSTGRRHRARTIWVSHLTEAELATLARRTPTSPSAPASAPASGSATAAPSRCGPPCWTPTRSSAATPTATAAARPRAPGTILVVSGGTAHGIGLEAPTGEATLKARAASIARGGLDAAGFVRSPYTVGGKQRLFAEPPHMQASMLFIPAGAAVPAVGDEVDCPGAVHRHRLRPRRGQLTRALGAPAGLVDSAAPGRARAAGRRAPPPPPGRARPPPAPRSRGRRPGRRRRPPLQPAAEVEPHRAEVEQLAGLPDQQVAPPGPRQHGERQQPEHVLRRVDLVDQQEAGHHQERPAGPRRGVRGARSPSSATSDADRAEQHPRPRVDRVAENVCPWCGSTSHTDPRSAPRSELNRPEHLPLLGAGQPGRQVRQRPRQRRPPPAATANSAEPAPSPGDDQDRAEQEQRVELGGGAQPDQHPGQHRPVPRPGPQRARRPTRRPAGPS